MAQSRKARGFGFLPPLHSKLSATFRDAETRARSALAAGEATIGAVRAEAEGLRLAARSKLEKVVSSPRGREPAVLSANAPRKAVSTSPTKQGVQSPGAKDSIPSSRQGSPAPLGPPRVPEFLKPAVAFAKEAGGQIAAGARGAADSASFGIWDPLQAADMASRTGAAGGTWQERYNTIRRGQIAQDDYDAKRYGAARTVGGVIGSVAPIVLTGGAGAAPIAVARAAANVPRTAQGLARTAAIVGPRTAVVAGGAGVGAGSQIESDILANRPVNGAATLSAALSGGTGAIFGSRNAPLGAATSAVVSNVSHAAMAGTPLSIDKVITDAGVGALFAATGRRAGHDWSHGLPINKDARKKQGGLTSKGELGEGLGEFLTMLRGERHVSRQTRLPANGGFTKVDEVTGSWSDPVQRYFRERKFGFSAGLSPRQKRAQAEQGDFYLVDRFTPDDIGNAVGSVAGIAAAQACTDEERAR